MAEKKSTSLWPDAEAANNAAKAEAERMEKRNFTQEEIVESWDHPVSCWCDVCTWVFLQDAEQDDETEEDVAWFGKNSNDGAPFGASSTPTTTTGNGYATPGPTAPVYKRCEHDGAAPQFWLNKEKTLSAAGGTGSSVWMADERIKLVIDLAGHVESAEWVKRAPKALQHLDLKEQSADYMRLAWVDQWPPDVEPGWFERLYKALLKSYTPGHVVFACMGGHGRTGTALAAMLLIGWPEMTLEEVVDLVRERHCPKAIETWRQVEWLMKFRPDAKFDKWLMTEAQPPKYIQDQRSGVSGGTTMVETKTPTGTVTTIKSTPGCSK